MKYVQDICGGLYNLNKVSSFEYQYCSVDNENYIDILITLEEKKRYILVPEYELLGHDPDLLIIGFLYKIMSCPFEIISQNFIETVMNQITHDESI